MTSERTDTATLDPRTDTRHRDPRAARDLDGDSDVDAAGTVHTHDHGDHTHTHAHPGGHEPHTHAERELRHEREDAGAPRPSDPGDGDGKQRLLRSNEIDDLRQRWTSVQASFIDAPREAVAEADHLVADLTDRITDRFGAERTSLEERWNRGEDVSTEDLRQSLQRYRSFFDRLLHL